MSVHPLRDRAVIAERLQVSASLASHVTLIRDIISDWADVERIVTRVALKTARPRDLSALRDALAAAPSVYPAAPLPAMVTTTPAVVISRI